MSGTIAISQTGIPATIQIVPGPGVAFTGQGAAGVGVAAAAVDGNGHLQVLLTNGQTVDAGAVRRRVVRCAAAPGNAPTRLVDGTNLVMGGPPGGGHLALPAPGLNLYVAVVNKTEAAQSIDPAANVAIDDLGPGVGLLVAAGTTEVLHSPDGLAWTSE